MAKFLARTAGLAGGAAAAFGLGSAYEVYEVDAEAYRKEGIVIGTTKARKAAADAYNASEERIAQKVAERTAAAASVDSAEREVHEAEQRLTAAMQSWETGLQSLRAADAAVLKEKAAAAALMTSIADHDKRLEAAQSAAAAARENARKVREAFPVLGANFPRW